MNLLDIPWDLVLGMGIKEEKMVWEVNWIDGREDMAMMRWVALHLMMQLWNLMASLMEQVYWTT